MKSEIKVQIYISKKNLSIYQDWWLPCDRDQKKDKYDEVVMRFTDQ